MEQEPPRRGELFMASVPDPESLILITHTSSRGGMDLKYPHF